MKPFPAENEEDDQGKAKSKFSFMKYQNEQAYFLPYEITGEQHFQLYDITGGPYYSIIHGFGIPGSKNRK